MERTVGAKETSTVLGGTLVLVKGKAATESIAIGPEPIVVGRARECAFVLEGDLRVSGMHFEVAATERCVRIKDLSSKNGTFVGGLRVRDADLTERVAIVCGGVTLEFVPTGEEVVETPSAPTFGSLVGASPVMQRVFARCAAAARSDLTVLLLGETGVGKEMFARTIHEESARRRKPYKIVDCGSIPPSLAESVLFGHEKGAFTGASAAKLSPFVEAEGGTIFLDEIGELPLDLQTRLLRVLAEKRVQAVGASRDRAIDVRVIAATRRNLKVESNRDRFRSDLYFRLAQLPITLPPLRERADDIPALVERMLSNVGRAPGTYTFARGSLEMLMACDWPGNVRELRNVVERAAHFCEGSSTIDFADALRGDEEDRDGATDAAVVEESRVAGVPRYDEAKDAFDREYFAKLCALAKNNVSEVARLAGRDRRTIRPYLQNLGLLAKPRKPTRR